MFKNKTAAKPEDVVKNNKCKVTVYLVLCGTCTIVSLCMPLFLYVYFFRSFLSKDLKGI